MLYMSLGVGSGGPRGWVRSLALVFVRGFRGFLIVQGKIFILAGGLGAGLSFYGF